MIHIRTTDGAPLELVVQPTPPIVYLDYCVVADLAVDQVVGPAFRDAIVAKEGTLLLSWAHLLEVMGLGVGPTFDAMDAYLSSFGRCFALLEADARTVIDRERGAQRTMTYAAADIEFTKLLGAHWDGLSDINVGIIFKGLRDDPSSYAAQKQMHKSHKVNTKRMFDEARRAYRTDPQARRNLDSKSYVYVPPNPPTDYLLNELTRECIRTNDQFNETDALDFQHAVVGSAYSDIIVLDKKWTRRVRALTQLHRVVKVYDTTEVSQMVQAVSSWMP